MDTPTFQIKAARQGPREKDVMAEQGIIPHLVVDDAAAAIDFYKRALDAVETLRVPTEDGKLLMHAEMEVNGAKVYLRDDFPGLCSSQKGKRLSPTALGGSPVMMHLDVMNCDAAVERAVSAGATDIMPPEDTFWGDRYAQVVDPYGHGWSFSHPL